MYRKVFAWVLIVVFLKARFMCFPIPNLLHAHSRSRWEWGQEDMGRRRRYAGRRRRRQVQHEESLEQAVPGDEDDVATAAVEQDGVRSDGFSASSAASAEEGVASS